MKSLQKSMKMKMKIILISIIALFFSRDSGSCVVFSSSEEDDGGFTAMKASTLLGGLREYRGNDIDGKIESIGRFAVHEHNKKENSLLKFAKVIKAKQQVVAGVMYHLTLEVIDGGYKKIYEAKVWVKPWMNFKQLEEFKHVASSTPNQPVVDEDSYSPGWQTVPTHDPTVLDAARYAVKTMQHRSNCIATCFLSEVLLAKAKVIGNDIKFYLVMKTKWSKREKIYKVMLFKNIHGKFYRFEFL